MAQAWQAWSEGKVKNAHRLVGKVIKTYPEHDHAWFLLGLCEGRLEHHAKSIECFAHVTHSPDLLPHVAQARGVAHLALNQPDQAVACFQEALLYRADQAQPHYLLGMAVKVQGDEAEAQRCLRRAVLLDPELSLAQFELGVLLLQEGAFSPALSHFQRAGKHLDAAPELHNNIGLCHQGLGQTQEAADAYRKAVSLKSDYAEAWFNLGTALGGVGTPEGEAAWQRAIEINPTLREAMNHGG